MATKPRTTSDGDLHEKPSRIVLDRIADLEDTTPAELSTPLYSVIDPDALDALFHSSGAETSETATRVEFTYCGYEVHVTDGDVSVFAV